MQRTDDNATRDGAITATISQVVAQRRTQSSPGRVFAQAAAATGTDTRVDYDTTITDSLTSSRRKPRHPARNMLKVVNLSAEPWTRYWHESQRRPDDPLVPGADVRREAANRFHSSAVPELNMTTAWVQVPDGLWEDPIAFESFINYRLVVRLCTAENHTIIKGRGGLASTPGIGHLSAAGPFGSVVLAACNEIEQMGSTADGMIINPADYYTLLGTGLIDVLERNGIFIVRTRLVDPGNALVGDFGHGAQLFDAGRSVIRFAEPPPDTFTEPGIALMAEIYEAVVVNLPTTFFTVSL